MHQTKISILANAEDDCLLYLNGKQYNDINYRDAMSIMLLKDIMPSNVSIEIIRTQLERKDFPNWLEELRPVLFKYRVAFWFGVYQINPFISASKVIDIDSDKELTDDEARLLALRKVGTYPKTYASLVQKIQE